MDWLQTLDSNLFLWINRGLAHKWLDAVMPFFSDNAFFYPALFLLGLLMVWKGGIRGWLCLLLLLLVTAIGDGLIVGTIKDAIGRVRPSSAIPEARALVGKGRTGSMPSAHAANWFAAAMVAFLFYRRSIRVTLPLAFIVAFSRVYNGAHYPSDVIAGSILGAGYAIATVWAVNALWSWAGSRWFPIWHTRLPSVLARLRGDEDEEPVQFPPRRGQASSLPGFVAPGASLDQHWVRLGYLWIGFLLLARWLYIADDTIQLSEDEAYQWVWSKHLALSYFSKPPLIAYAQFLGTNLWGDSAFGVRFFSPLIAAILSFVVLRFVAREVNGRAGFFLLLICAATPLLAAGSVLMTVDPLSVLFWTAAMVAGWRASQDHGSLRDWAWVGLWMGLGFLSKYTQLLQWFCWAVFFVLWAPARKHLRRPGPYLALLINLLFTTPVLLWNAQHNWVTVAHVADNAGAGRVWTLTDSVKFFAEFLGAEFGLLNPVFFCGALWAAAAFWNRNRRNPRMVYCFSMGTPLFMVYLVFSLKSRVFPNWIAPAVIPMFCLMVMYWDSRFRLGTAAVKRWLLVGLVVGFPIVILFHDTSLIGKLAGHPLPVKYDPLRRVRYWDRTAATVEQQRQELLLEGRPAFIIGHHYGITGQLSFHLPEARASIKTSPLVYAVSTPTPRNQFYFWPGYNTRKGENAIFVRDLSPGKRDQRPPPAVLLEEFESVEDLGIHDVLGPRGVVVRSLHMFACRGLK